MDIDWRLMADTVAKTYERLNGMDVRFDKIEARLDVIEDAVNHGFGRMNAMAEDLADLRRKEAGTFQMMTARVGSLETRVTKLEEV